MTGKLGTSVSRVLLGMLAAAALAAGSITAQAAPISGQGTWETTLQPRDLDGDPTTIEAWYDTVLDLLWLEHPVVNYTWSEAMAWAASLDIHGVTGWRLPVVVDTGAPGCDSSSGGTDCGFNVDTSGSEWAHLWYETLGNLARFAPGIETSPQPGWGLSNTGPFQHLEAGTYWTGTASAANPVDAWMFQTSDGLQSINHQDSRVSVMAVRPGDVVARVPEPGTLAMLFGGLAVLGLVRARQRS